MIKLFKKLFAGKDTIVKPTLVDKHFGLIQYDENSKTWQTLENDIYLISK